MFAADRRFFAKVNRGRLGYITAQILGERGSVIGENLRVIGSPRNGDIREARTDEFWVNIGIHVHQDAL